MYHELGNTKVNIKNMAYTQNPNIPKVRMEAVRLVKYRGWSMCLTEVRPPSNL